MSVGGAFRFGIGGLFLANHGREAEGCGFLSGSSIHRGGGVEIWEGIVGGLLGGRRRGRGLTGAQFEEGEDAHREDDQKNCGNPGRVARRFLMQRFDVEEHEGL